MSWGDGEVGNEGQKVEGGGKGCWKREVEKGKAEEGRRWKGIGRRVM